MRATLTAAVDLVAASTDRVRRGMALPYGPAGRTSAGPVRAAAGRIRWPAEVRRVKVFSDHGRTSPIGYCTAISETDAGLTVAFTLAGTPAGDLALAEVDGGVRDAISVELDDVELDDAGLITAASLTAIALVPLPAFADARIAASLHTEGDPMPDQTTVVVNPPTTPTPAPTTPAPTTPAPAPTPDPAPADPPASLNASVAVRDRPLDLHAAAAHLETAWRRDPRAESINAALADIVPANDADGRGILTPQWLGELWRPYAVTRNYINSVKSAELTGMSLFGYAWKTRPVVGAYAGNKTAIPSNPVELEPVNATAYRLAGGWDVDRVFYDLGTPGFLDTILSMATEDLRNKQEQNFGAALVGGATIPAGTPATLFDALSLIAVELGKIGATPTGIAVASDLYGELLAIPASAAPWWLSTSSSSVNIGDQTATLNGFRGFVDPALPAGSVVGWDRRAATYYEARPTPIRVQAVNIPNGGIDVAVFSYQAQIINEARAIVRTTVVAGTTLAASSSSSKSK